MATTRLTRRGLLQRGGALIACSAAAHPLMTTVTFASAPWENRLVVIILRGAMDGLDVVRPLGDPAFMAMRGGLLRGRDDSLPLDGYFAMHPALAPLMPLWSAGQLAFAHAVSTPYRDKRSHFDGQDILEAGTGMDVPASARRDGWLNRMLATVPGMNAQTAFAVGRDELKVLNGPAPVMNWSPDAALNMSPQARLLLQEVYHEDPLFRDAADEAVELAELVAPDESTPRGAAMADAMKRGGGTAIEALAAFSAQRLREETRIAAFSMPGWDTHRRQPQAIGGSLARLSDAILLLKQGLGPVWDKTCVVAMTEFGRTVRENGSGGTDHGTGGAMLFAGGAIRGGRVMGTWPGLDEAALYQRRDLMPTSDVRQHAAWAMRGLFGLPSASLERDVFPGLDMGTNPGLIL
ncbi:DUF1501 domain-containing protein [Oceaniglobus indicus]|uniref:DUF1501 domain-containing protein n=1 Tax=Oceaniglobus indicus TaxID=2047749 RepID=UPI000C182717|nr:DUF1501 domain-containing protein [Oceaniglobus indicus]